MVWILIVSDYCNLVFWIVGENQSRRKFSRKCIKSNFKTEKLFRFWKHWLVCRRCRSTTALYVTLSSFILGYTFNPTSEDTVWQTLPFQTRNSKTIQLKRSLPKFLKMSHEKDTFSRFFRWICFTELLP